MVVCIKTHLATILARQHHCTKHLGHLAFPPRTEMHTHMAVSGVEITVDLHQACSGMTLHRGPHKGLQNCMAFDIAG